jgi:hypothetical protein
MSIFPGNADSSGCLTLIVYPLALLCIVVGWIFMVQGSGGFFFVWTFLALTDLALWMVFGVHYMNGDHKLSDGSWVSKILVSTWWVGIGLLWLLLLGAVISAVAESM